jgi:hypothetical protein
MGATHFSGPVISEGGFIGQSGSVSTAGNVTYTMAQILAGLILRDAAGANRTDTTPTAAQIVAGMAGALAGSTLEFAVRNISGGAFTVTVQGGAGVTGTVPAIAQNTGTRMMFVITNAAPGAEAVSIYAV